MQIWTKQHNVLHKAKFKRKPFNNAVSRLV